MPLVVSLYGGLGNQLFQYFHGRRLAARSSQPLLIDFSQVQLGGRDFELARFGLSPPLLNPEELTRARRILLTTMPRILVRAPLLGKVFNRLAVFLGAGQTTVQSSHRFRDYSAEITGDWNFFHGSWQSERFFEEIRDSVSDELEVVRKRGGSLWGDLDLIDSVAVHVRRGDYVTNPETTKVHGICPPGYYESAMDRIADAVPGAHFFVFSDDPDWVAKEFKPSHPFRLINTNDNGCDDLAMMSCCDHFIIANSSFSWWAAWIGEQKGSNSIVIAPDPWFLEPKFQENDIIPARWVVHSFA